MGRSMRINEAFYDAFYSAFVLGTFTNSRFSSMKDYFDSVMYQNVTFPQYSIDDYTIFSSRTDFVRYVKARKYLKKIEHLTDHFECVQTCRTIFKELKNIPKERIEDGIFRDAPHLFQFTDRAVYVSTLSKAIDKLVPKFASFTNDVKLWLEYLIKEENFEHRIGDWYSHLIHLYMRFTQPFNYDHAAELLIDVLGDKREHLSEVQLYQLAKWGKQLMSTKKYKILPSIHDHIARILPKPMNQSFGEKIIDPNTIRENFVKTSNNKDITLKYYLDQHGYDGVRCDGALVKTTFTLFFFDIIYSPKRSIPGTFVSKVQSEPLDMNTRYFYLNRREEIDKRLKEIECEWSDSDVIKFLGENYEKHSHEFAVCEVGDIIKDPKRLEMFVQCIGRSILAKIYKRLVQNFREYTRGLPDLFIWNVDNKECKFIYVKGTNDKLSIGQTLWLNYLVSIGAQTDVCRVNSSGSKTKVKQVEGKGFSKASTSASPNLGQHDTMSAFQTLWLNYLQSIGAQTEVSFVNSSGSKTKAKKVEGKSFPKASTSASSNPGQHDTMSVFQTLWLNYLQSIGTQTEVSFVNSSGSKTKLKKVEGKGFPNASTSASPNLGQHDPMSIFQTLWLNYLQSIAAQTEVCFVNSNGFKTKVSKAGGKGQLPSTSSSVDNMP